MSGQVFNPNNTSFVRNILGGPGVGTKRLREDTYLISIGQNIEPSANPTFASVSTTGSIHAGTTFRMGTSSVVKAPVVAADTSGTFAFGTAPAIDSIIAGSSTSVSHTGSTYAVSVAPSGVTPGTYNHANITLNDRGLVTAASSSSSVDTLAAGTGLSVSNTGSAYSVGIANTAVTPGSYVHATVSVNAQGQITAASSNPAVEDITAGTGIQVASIYNTYAVGLANTGVTPGTFSVPTMLVNAQGQIVAATSGSVVTSVAGTANQIITSNTAGAVTFSTPQSIGTSSTVQFASVGANCTPLSAMDVNGGLAVGAYAGVSTPPTNGIIASGRVTLGATSSITNLAVFGSTSNFDQVGTVCLRTAKPGTSTGFPTIAFGINNATNSMTNAYIQAIETGIATRPLLLGNTGAGVGIGDSFIPGSSFGVKGSTCIGSTYCTLAAPANGQIIEGNLSVGKSSNTYPCDIAGDIATTTGLRLPASGGTPTLLDFYEKNFIFTTAITGPITSTSVGITFSRIGNMVTMVFPSISQPSSGSTAPIQNSTTIPARFQPTAIISTYVTSQSNGVYSNSNCLISGGLLSIYATAPYGAWSVTGTNAVSAFTASWLV